MVGRNSQPIPPQPGFGQPGLPPQIQQPGMPPQMSMTPQQSGFYPVQQGTQRRKKKTFLTAK
jgi:hypothetical protein